MSEADGPVAIVTGAASGIGRGAALRLTTEGYRALLFDIDREGLEAALQADLGGYPVTGH